MLMTWLILSKMTYRRTNTMNEERYILAQLIRRMTAEDRKELEKNGWHQTWHLSDICLMIEQIRADAVLGEPEGEYPPPWASQEVE